MQLSKAFKGNETEGNKMLRVIHNLCRINFLQLFIGPDLKKHADYECSVKQVERIQFQW